MERREQRRSKKDHSLQGGFSFIELILALSLGSVLLAGCLQVQLLIRRDVMTVKVREELQMEAEAFIRYLSAEARCTDAYYSTGTKLYFYHGTDRLDYRQASRVIVREKNGSGYVTVCYDVQNVGFRPQNGGLGVDITLEKRGIVWQVHTFIANYVSYADKG